MLFLWLAWSRLGAGSRYPAGKRLVPAAVRRLEEHRLPELVVTAVAGDQDVTHAAAAAAAGSFAGRFNGHGFQLTCALPGHSW